MAEKPQVVVQMSPDAHAAQEITAGLDAFEQAGVGRNNNITKPGGHYIGTDGKPHDAHGRKIGESSDVDTLSADEAASRIAELTAERDALMVRLQQAQSEEARDAEIAAEGAPVADDAEPSRAKKKTTKKK